MNAKTRKPARKVPDGAKAEKNIYKRGDYSYQVKMMVGGHTIVETFDTLPEARAFRDSKKAASVLDPDFKRVLESRIKKTEAASSSLSWLLDRYESEVTATKKSAVSEKYRIGKLKRFDIASRSIYTITADDVSEFLRDLKADGVAAPGQRKYCALLSQVFNTAAKRWRLKVSNPIATMELPSAGKARNRRLEGDEAAKLFEALDHENALAGAFVRLAVETAMRRGELVGLLWDDVNIESQVAELHDTKNGDARRVPLSKAAVKILLDIPEPHKGRVLPIHPSALRGAWDRTMEKTGIKDLRVHDLRHEATSRLFEKGLDSMEVAAITGHKTLQMLKRYTHLRAEDLAKKLG